MAHVVMLNAREEAGETLALPLDRPLGPGAAIASAREPMGDTWVVIADPGFRTLVNGRVSHTGLHVLRGGDEIRTHDGARYVFSNEHRAEPVAFPGADRAVRCGRCTTELEPGTPSVRCPGCSSWYHEQADFNCWSSVPFCQVCGHRTAADGTDTGDPHPRLAQES
jgi:hypothetical protein